MVASDRSTALAEDGGLLAPFSNHGRWVHVAAPGVDIVSTIPGGGVCARKMKAKQRADKGVINVLGSIDKIG